ncbi:hypothetical protein J2801_002576 [Paraburkholderia phenoliruptrix]|uniref:hypothetical protein n=1 Tax=Paraburkholderia phenoliruptrix TaxID=252970 RepID=UPI0028654196|nr:hypothetical protein [Paraburkholderia phenoliruptrix]MDR6420295.1 hypothetical protein [Paraburkholderia phenoliruptrix]
MSDPLALLHGCFLGNMLTLEINPRWVLADLLEDRVNPYAFRAVARNYPKLGLRRLLVEASLVIGPGQDDGRTVKAATP